MTPDKGLFKKKIHIPSIKKALAAFGQFDSNLRRLEKNNKVRIQARGNTATVTGSRSGVEETVRELERLSREGDTGPGESPAAPGEFLRTPTGKPIKPLSPRQKDYVRFMEEKDLTVAIGPAGTGKTFLACAEAVKMLRRREIERVILTRPIVEAGERLGYLPGDLQEKINPYLRPLYDAFYTLMGPERFHKYARDDIIELVPLAYMRGRTLDDAMIILDEAQNTSSGQMQMFLTRIGFNSKAVITGDVTQIDLEQRQVSGLVEIQEILKGLDGVEFVYFNREDVVRHQLVKRIVDAYNKFKKNKASAKK